MLTTHMVALETLLPDLIVVCWMWHPEKVSGCLITKAGTDFIRVGDPAIKPDECSGVL